MERVDRGLHPGPAVAGARCLGAVVVVHDPRDLARRSDEFRERRSRRRTADFALASWRPRRVDGGTAIRRERRDRRKVLIGDDRRDDPDVGEFLGQRGVARPSGVPAAEVFRDLAEFLEQPQRACRRGPVAAEVRHRRADVELGDGACGHGGVHVRTAVGGFCRSERTPDRRTVTENSLRASDLRSIGPVTAPTAVHAPDLAVQVLDERAVVPQRAHDGDAGLDLSILDAVTIAPGARARVGTGLAVAIPAGYAGFVVPRSGLAARLGLSVVNTPGIIDAGYRGELQLLLLNTDRDAPIELAAGERVAQLLIVPVALSPVVVVDELPEAGDARGTGGYGSTGT